MGEGATRVSTRCRVAPDPGQTDTTTQKEEACLAARLGARNSVPCTPPLFAVRARPADPAQAGLAAEVQARAVRRGKTLNFPALDELTELPSPRAL